MTFKNASVSANVLADIMSKTRDGTIKLADLYRRAANRLPFKHSLTDTTRNALIRATLQRHAGYSDRRRPGTTALFKNPEPGVWALTANAQRAYGLV